MNGVNGTEFQQRLTTARERRCGFEFVYAYFGLDLDSDKALRRDFEFWLRQRGEQNGLADHSVDRWRLEPLSPRYQIWLDFGKWMTLPPEAQIKSSSSTRPDW
ncbi:MAG TPA: hypothetical protein PK867_15890 [Pirellulales bacterium]|nr:hypothetical protein [Pirellulales bacterium]